MFRLLDGVGERCRPSHFFLCPDDRLALNLLPIYQKRHGRTCKLHTVPRPRRVGQSYVTSLFSTLWTIVCCIRTLIRTEDIDLVSVRWHSNHKIVCNGPGICVCLIMAVYIASIVSICPMMSHHLLDKVETKEQTSLCGKFRKDQKPLNDRQDAKVHGR